MLSKIKSLTPQMLARRCVACGYDGSLLRDGKATHCSQCGCDLHRRPARSYAEMEGLIETAPRVVQPMIWPRDESHLLRRWLAVLFMWAVLLGAIMCLSVAAMAGM